MPMGSTRSYNEFMSAQILRNNTPAPPRRVNPNRIFFPRNLRDAIPDLPTCIGRDLVLDSMQGRPTRTPWFGKRVQLNLVAKETGKLKGEFVVQIDVAPEAARALAETLMRLADQAEQKTQHS